MAKASLLEKTVRVDKQQIIKFQISTYCFFNNIQLSNNELDCLTLLAAYGQYELSEFCNISVDENIFKSPQTVRNFFTRTCSLGLTIKEGTTKKTIEIAPKLQVLIKGNIILNYKIIYVTKEQ